VTAPIIEIEDFSYRYPRTSTPALTHINLTIHDEEFVGIVGPTGAGKTTLCLALHGFLPQILGGKVEGRILLAGKDTRTTPISELAFSSIDRTALVGMVFQDPEGLLVGMSVEEDLAFGPENLGVPPDEIEARVQEALQTTRIEAYRHSFPYTLSGGQKQRTAIASALAMRPKVLILDEPTSELDPVGREEVFEVIKELKSRARLTVIVVEHHMEELVQFVDRLVVLVGGQIVLDGPTPEVLKQTSTLRNVGVRPPEVMELLDLLNQRGLVDSPEGSPNGLLDEENAAAYLISLIKARGAYDAAAQH
jgi:energy-coupling factor transporter ATP-binding protein EcfA2